MELTLSTHLLVYGPLQPETLDSLAGTPFRTLEVWLAEPHVPWRHPAELAVFGRRLTDRGLCPGSVHLPFYPSVPELRDQGRKWSLIDPEFADRRIALEGTREGLQAAAALGARSAVLHLGWQRDTWGQREEDWAREAVASLLPEAQACGVRLLLENIISSGTRSRRLVELLDEVDPAGQAGLCLDLGHAHVEGQILEELEHALPRLAHLHVHDNDGQRDAHQAPGCGSIPWEAVLTRLKQVEFGGLAALELRDLSKGRRPCAEVLAEELPKVAAFQEHWESRGLLDPPAKVS